MAENNTIERMTVTVTQEMAQAIKAALNEGAYASSSEIVREALRDWQHKQQLKAGELAALRRDIATADRDVAEGRVSAFDAQKIVEKGRSQSPRR